MVSLHQHQTAQAQHQLWSLSKLYTPLFTCHGQCWGRPCHIAPNVHAEWNSPPAAGNLNISRYTILYTFKLHNRRIWLFAALPAALSLLIILNWTLTMNQSNTWTSFPTSNTLKTSDTQSLNHCHLLCCGRRCTLALLPHTVVPLLSHGNAMLRGGLGQTY